MLDQFFEIMIIFIGSIAYGLKHLRTILKSISIFSNSFSISSTQWNVECWRKEYVLHQSALKKDGTRFCN